MLKKENLIKAAVHFGITPAVGATKSHILDLIEDYCVENNIIDEVEENCGNCGSLKLNQYSRVLIMNMLKRQSSKLTS